MEFFVLKYRRVLEILSALRTSSARRVPSQEDFQNTSIFLYENSILHAWTKCTFGSVQSLIFVLIADFLYMFFNLIDTFKDNIVLKLVPNLLSLVMVSIVYTLVVAGRKLFRFSINLNFVMKIYLVDYTKVPGSTWTAPYKPV